MIELNKLNEEDQQTPPAICYYPGSFKPPNEGNFEAVRKLASYNYVTKIIVLIGHKEYGGVNKEQSKNIWDLYLKTEPMGKVTVRISTNPSPIKDIITIMDGDLELKAYVAGSPQEEEDKQYFEALQKAFSTRIMPISIEENIISQGKAFTSTQVLDLINQLKQSVQKLQATTDNPSNDYSKARNEYLNTFELLKGCFPEAVVQKGGFESILGILGIPLLDKNTLQEQNPLTYKAPSQDLPVSKDDDVNKGEDTVIKVPYHKTSDLENYLNSNLIPFEYSQYNFGGDERRMVIPNLGDKENGKLQRSQVIGYLNKSGIPHDLEEYKLDVKPTVSIKDVDREELKRGIQVEKEHTTDNKTATRIALDHLSEDPKYYTKLDKAGLEETFTIKWWKQNLQEEDKPDDIFQDFIDFCIKSLELKEPPKINFTDDEEIAKSMHSLGVYNDKNDELLVVKGPRLTADILRTLGHELVHRKQDELGLLGPDSGMTGSPIENEANAAAGILMRTFGKYRPEIFESLTEESTTEKYKVYCDMDGVLVDFDKGYQDLTGKDIRGSFDSAEEFWKPIEKAGAAFWIRLKWMPDGKQLWNYLKPHNPELLSAPSREESSKMGKRIWVRNNIPGTKLILRSAERKQELATPNAILIDDRKDNIERWNAAGGIGIYHTTTADTLQQLQKLGL